MSKIKCNQIETVDGTLTHDVATMGIESGSNSEGSWVKFPDGTMICYGRYEGNTPGPYTFPQAYIDNNIHIQISMYGSENPQPISEQAPKDITTTDFRRDSESWGFMYIAIGRWK